MNFIPLPTANPEIEFQANSLDMSFANCYKLKHFKKNDMIYRQGNPADAIYFLEKGRIILGCQSDDGRVSMKEVVYPGDIFGELAILGDSERMGFAKALDPEVCVRKIPKDDFLQLLLNNPMMKEKFFRMIGVRMNKVNNKIEDLIIRDARSRIINYLVSTALEKGQKVGFEMMIKDPLKHKDIANLTGTSRQTTTTILNELKAMNLINMDKRRILIRDIEALSDLR